MTFVGALQLRFHISDAAWHSGAVGRAVDNHSATSTAPHTQLVWHGTDCGRRSHSWCIKVCHLAQPLAYLMLTTQGDAVLHASNMASCIPLCPVPAG